MQRFRVAVAIATICCTLAATATVAGAQDETAQVDDPTSIEVTGHGWGHGRGMSQYGALGYALNFGWTSPQILDHYYGGTTAGVVGNSLMTVRIEDSRSKPTVAQVDSGVMVLIDANDNVTHIGSGRAVRLTAVEGGFTLADAPTCSGPFVDRAGIVEGEIIRISTADTPDVTGLVGTVSDGTVVMGDWDGDGDDEAATADGVNWTLYNGTVTNPAASVRETFTMPAGDAVSGDWDGDGVDTAGIFEGGVWTLGNGAGNTSDIAFGEPGDFPIVGDWDGDGNDDLGVRRGNTWILSPGGGAPTIEFDWGWLSDTPLVGDWDGDGIDDAGLLRGREWTRRIRTGATLGTQIPKITYANKNHYLIGDWDGDGVDEPGRHDSGVVKLPNPNAAAGGNGNDGQVVPRLDPNLPLEQTIQRCVSETEQRYYRGELRAVNNDLAQRTVNALPVESYLRAVVPLEMPASWALLGDGAGAQALQSQAVSARSYSLAENRASYALTCDTISCQVYGGRAVRRSGELTPNEDDRANAAIAATAGVVRVRDGEVARTEFSSSTGGWTAGGVFPAVEDLGDAVDRNPNYDWTIGISISNLESRFSGRQLDRVYVSERNGLGRDGGRVEEVTLQFGDEVFTMTGNEFRRANALKSDWFSIDWERDSPLAPCICPEEWPDRKLIEEHEAFTGA